MFVSLAEKNSLASIIAVIGLAVMFAMPMLLATGTVAYFDSKVIQKAPTSAGQAQAPENYARTFYMVVRDQGQDIHIWAKDLGSAPYFRQAFYCSSYKPALKLDWSSKTSRICPISVVSSSAF